MRLTLKNVYLPFVTITNGVAAILSFVTLIMMYEMDIVGGLALADMPLDNIQLLLASLWLTFFLHLTVIGAELFTKYGVKSVVPSKKYTIVKLAVSGLANLLIFIFGIIIITQTQKYNELTTLSQNYYGENNDNKNNVLPMLHNASSGPISTKPMEYAQVTSALSSLPPMPTMPTAPSMPVASTMPTKSTPPADGMGTAESFAELRQNAEFNAQNSNTMQSLLFASGAISLIFGFCNCILFIAYI